MKTEYKGYEIISEVVLPENLLFYHIEKNGETIKQFCMSKKHAKQIISRLINKEKE